MEKTREGENTWHCGWLGGFLPPFCTLSNFLPFKGHDEMSHFHHPPMQECLLCVHWQSICPRTHSFFLSSNHLLFHPPSHTFNHSSSYQLKSQHRSLKELQASIPSSLPQNKCLLDLRQTEDRVCCYLIQKEVGNVRDVAQNSGWL